MGSRPRPLSRSCRSTSSLPPSRSVCFRPRLSLSVSQTSPPTPALRLFLAHLVVCLALCVRQFLAFKSDVDFWRRNKSLRGLSVRTLFMEVFFQTIILLSLVEEEASLLVTVPAGVGVLIQVR